jgi:carbonic anhydrase
MKNYILFLLRSLIVLLLLNSCKDGPQNTSSNDLTIDDNESHWSYQGETGPEHWSEIEKNSTCDGQRQSPINIIDIEVMVDSSLTPLKFAYSENTKIHDVTNNGHTIQFNFEKGDYIVLNEKKFELLQIHFHEPSEHTINGIRYPIEVHFVHLNKANNQLMVLAIFGKEGVNNELFTFLESYLPIQVGDTKYIGVSFDLNSSLPDNLDYYNYQGSLTTPPCTEGVNWYVIKSPITLSVKQVKELQELMPLNNYRKEQPINSRIIRQMPLKPEFY